MPASSPKVSASDFADSFGSICRKGSFSFDEWVRRREPDPIPMRKLQYEEAEMRVLIMAKEGNQSGAATPPTPEAMADYQKFDQELVKAGVVLGAGRLHPSSQGKRVRFDGKKRTVIDGPFAQAKELVGGSWLWQGRGVRDGRGRD